MRVTSTLTCCGHAPDRAGWFCARSVAGRSGASTMVVHHLSPTSRRVVRQERVVAVGDTPERASEGHLDTPHGVQAHAAAARTGGPADRRAGPGGYGVGF